MFLKSGTTYLVRFQRTLTYLAMTVIDSTNEVMYKL
jgi:hypothetical protein